MGMSERTSMSVQALGPISRIFVPLLLVVAFIGTMPVGAQLPPAIQADRYLVQAERELANGDPAAALATLDLILELQSEHGLEIPEAFWFKRAQVSYDAGLHETAVESAIRYLEIAGQDGEHYRAALELYDEVEMALGDAAWGLQPGETFSDTLSSGGQGPEMVVIPAGRFRMGCLSGQECFDIEFPVHDVTIPQAFAVSKYEVTFEDYDRYTYPNRVDDAGWGRGRRPVINVSWNDAQDYVEWLSAQTGHAYRLLSEAEWEYVARAGSSTVYSWGNDIGSNRANCRGCGSQWDDDRTAPVGSFPPNAFGVHDMHGNVEERVEDCSNGSYAVAPTDGSAWRSGDCEWRSVRGGSWGSNRRSLRSANRSGWSTGIRLNFLGFRVARTLAP